MKSFRKQVVPASGQDRQGAALVEFAVVFPVFMLFLMAMWEFTHAYMVVNVMNQAASKAARFGVSQDITSEEVASKVEEVLTAAFDTSNATVMIKDASVFDTYPMTPDDIDYSSLPDIELSDAEPQQLFVVLVTVPYNDIAITGPMWAKSLTLRGQSVMRHE